MELDPDSEELIMQGLDDDWFMEEENDDTTKANDVDGNKKFHLHPHQLPFVDCDSPEYNTEYFSPTPIQEFELFDINFDNLENDFNLLIIEEQCLFRLNFLNSSQNNLMPIVEILNRSVVIGELHFLLAILRKTMKTSPSVFKIIKMINIVLGPVTTTSSKDIRHLNISAKWTLMEFYINYSDFESVYDDVEGYLGVLLNLIDLSQDKLSQILQWQPEKMISSVQPFHCPCIKSLWTYIINTFQAMFWKDLRNLIVQEELLPVKTSSNSVVITTISTKSSPKSISWTAYWWILSHLDLQESPDVHTFLGNQLKGSILKSKSSVEINIAIAALHKIAQLMPLNIEILSCFWDYFKERINRNFMEVRKETLENLAIIPQDHNAWYQDASKEILNNSANINIFKSYQKLISLHFAQSKKADKDMQRFLTRLRTKMAFAQFSELGLYNTISLFLNLYVSQGGKDEIAKTFIGIMENGMAQLQRKDFLPTIGKGIGAFIVAQIKYRSKNELIYSAFNLLVEKVLEEAIKYKNQNPTVNSTLTSKVIKSYLCVIRDCLHVDVILSVDKLISPSLIHYLSLYASHSELKTSEASFILESMTEVVTVLRRYLGATKHYNGITNAKEVGNVDIKTRIEKQLVPLFHPHGKLFGIIKNILANSLTAPAKSLASLICAIFLLGGGKSEAIKKSLIYFMTNSKVQPIVVLELLHEITQSDTLMKQMSQETVQGWLRVSMLIDTTHQTLIQVNTSLTNVLKSVFGGETTLEGFIIKLGKKVSLADHHADSLKSLWNTNQIYLNVMKTCALEDKGIGNLVMYPKICLILQHLSPLFYWKSSLKNLTDQIMIPIKDVKKPLKNEMKTTILKCLPNAISGICKSTKNLDKDEFIKNSLRNVFKEVMEKFNVQDLTEFFYLILNHEEDRLSDLIFRVIRDNFLVKKNLISLNIVQKCIECSQNLLPIENNVNLVLPGVLAIWLETSHSNNTILKNKASETIIKYLDNPETTHSDFGRCVINFIHGEMFEKWREIMNLLKAIKVKNRKIFEAISEDVNIEIEKMAQRRPHVGLLVRSEFQKLL